MMGDTLYSAAFDEFLTMETWYTFHPNDEDRFYHALAKVVRDPNFNADNMGTYLRERLEVGDNEHFDRAISKYVAKAWAVRDYLNSTDGL